MLSLREIEIFLQRIPVQLQDIVLELRNIVAAVAPDAVEVIRRGGLSYFHEGGGLVSGGICVKQLVEEASQLDPRSLRA
jgi:hypothetical protein